MEHENAHHTEETEYKSKTQKKKEAQALQNLGEELALLPLVNIKRMDLPQDLKTALIEGKSITSNIAARRHRQYIGTLMRDVDPQTIRREMELSLADTTVEAKPLSPSQEWVERLTQQDDAPIEDCLDAFPGLDRQQLRQLVRNARKEISSKKPGKSLKNLHALIKSKISS